MTYVSGHDGGLLKVIGHLLGLDSCDRLDRHVGQGDQASGHLELDGEGSLDSRLVPAWEGHSAGSGFELCHAHVLSVALGVLVRRAVEAGHLVVKNTVKVNAQDGGTLGQFRFESKGGGLTVVVIRCGSGLVAIDQVEKTTLFKDVSTNSYGRKAKACLFALSVKDNVRLSVNLHSGPLKGQLLGVDLDRLCRLMNGQAIRVPNEKTQQS